jgi:hypothetical protein
VVPHHGSGPPDANNVCRSNSQGGAGIWSGITLDSDAAASPTTRCIVSGNLSVDTQGFPTQKYGISVISSSGSQTNDNPFVNNTGSSNAGGLYSQTAGLRNGWATSQAVVPVAYSGSMVLDVTQGALFTIDATNTNNFTIRSPSNPLPGSASPLT